VQLEALVVAWYFPALQFRQVLAPVAFWYLPATQLAQLLAPAAENLPCEQAVHLLPALKWPALHVSCEHALWPVEV
jgi:hypothetical protein